MLAFKSHIRRAASGGRDHVVRLGEQVQESTPLLSEDPTQRNKDGRPWVHYPVEAVRLTWLTLKSNIVNVFLVFVPLGIIAGELKWSPIAVFVLNFLAIIPLASLLSFATEELSAKLGQTLGGLLNATFGNAVELIVCTRSP